MDSETLKALDQSIEKWERNAVAIHPWEYTTHALAFALCNMFEGHGCRGCPVSKRTEKADCRDTPYAAAKEAKYTWSYHPDSSALRVAAHAAARAEADFLRSLLPEGEDR